ncbi:hypothetical protein ACSZNJ_18845 [Aeromonas hydrophila]
MNKPQQEQHGVMDRFYRALAPEVAQSLSETQRNGIEQALRVMSNGKSHAINVNSAFGLGNWRCYLVVLVGRDRRRSQRESGLRFQLKVLLTTLLLLTGLCGTVLLLYLIKSALGIDIFKDFSFGIWDLFKQSLS